MQIPDHPDIRRAELTGYYDKEPDEYDCPICGDSCQIYYKRDGVIIGCNHCIKEEKAW